MIENKELVKIKYTQKSNNKAKKKKLKNKKAHNKSKHVE